MSHPSTELSLALYNPAKDSISNTRFEGTLPVDNKNKRIRSSLFVKVCLDGNSMCRKLDLLAHDGYSSLITTLSHMFNTTTLYPEAVCIHAQRHHHVLTYIDREGDWMMAGDVPWEMFLASVKKLMITRTSSVFLGSSIQIQDSASS
ncbi:auxin-responsive protein IAA31-like [Populus alba x Populus x berolinensis]|nr:auxin-responsive protein IAA31-like [Populus alba x Populus x berolinensis]